MMSGKMTALTSAASSGTSATTAVLPSGATLQLAAAFPESCPESGTLSSSSVPSAQVDLSAGAVKISGAQLPSDIAACNGELVTVTPPATGDNSAFDGLNVQATLPTSVSPGQTLDYTITLQNSGTSAVSLATCPSYTVDIGPSPLDEYSEQLNCGSIAEIPAGGSQSFAMETPVAANAVGSVRIAWLLDGGPSGGGTVSLS
jgi:hypothetical protein